MSNEKPVNFDHFIKAAELALTAARDIPEESIEDILSTVEEACICNEEQLMWEDDYEEFVSVLDGLLDSIYGNGYDEQVNQLDDLRAKMEAQENQSQPSEQPNQPA